VKNGLFSTVLGEQTPFGAAVKFDKQYWLGIQVGNEPELSSRIALTSVGYSFSSLRADTASVSVASLADTTWKQNGSNIYRMNGNVGIGTDSPGEKLTINGDSRVTGNLVIHAQPTTYYERGFTKYLNTNGSRQTETGLIWGYQDNIYGNGTGASPVRIDFGQNDFKSYFSFKTFHAGNDADLTEDIRINAGNVGIGTANPHERLEVNGNVRLPSGNKLQVWTSQGNGGIHWDNNVDAGFYLYQDGTSSDRGRVLWLEGFANGNIFAISNRINFGIGTSNPSSKLDVNGTTTTKVLAITGGSDLAEPFEISESQPIPKGALVIIDEENPGQLKLSHQAYDKRVAGVVSGAGGINPGLTLTQEGVLEGGQNVALSGRVYALATAANGPIKPGDLLTTSKVPGHAMKATDRERAYGAVIGKAMSPLQSGEGLVLVLIQPH